jgi:hypothetical protein
MITLDQFIEGSEEIMGFYRLLVRTAEEADTEESRDMIIAILHVIEHIQATVDYMKAKDVKNAERSMFRAIKMEQQFMEKAWEYAHRDDAFAEAMKNPQ